MHHHFVGFDQLFGFLHVGNLASRVAEDVLILTQLPTATGDALQMLATRQSFCASPRMCLTSASIRFARGKRSYSEANS